MLKLLLTVIGLLVLGGGPVWLYDHHPAWSFAVPIPIRWLPHVPAHLVWNSVASDRDAKAAAVVTWKTAYNGLAAPSQAQEKAQEGVDAAGAVKLAAAAPLPSLARSGQLTAQSDADAILAMKANDADRCKFAQSVDRSWVEALK